MARTAQPQYRASDRDEKVAYAVCGTDLQWHIKRLQDGKLICRLPDKADAKNEAKRRGYQLIRTT